MRNNEVSGKGGYHNFWKIFHFLKNNTAHLKTAKSDKNGPADVAWSLLVWMVYKLKWWDSPTVFEWAIPKFIFLLKNWKRDVSLTSMVTYNLKSQNWRLTIYLCTCKTKLLYYKYLRNYRPSKFEIFEKKRKYSNFMSNSVIIMCYSIYLRGSN